MEPNNSFQLVDVGNMYARLRETANPLTCWMSMLSVEQLLSLDLQYGQHNRGQNNHIYYVCDEQPDIAHQVNNIR